MDRRFTRGIVCLEELRGLANVAQIYAHDRYPDPLQGWQFYVQEFVPGSETLIDWARRTVPSLRELANVFKQLAHACGEMAHADIRHRDLKPSNILMSAGGVPKIIDFDSAVCFRAEELTGPLPSEVPGTLAYLSPEHCVAILKESAEEQASPFLYLPTADLHALGVIFYEVFTGKYPFKTGLTQEDLLRRIAYERPPRPSELNPRIPFALDDLVMDLLAKDPSARCQHGDDLAAELKSILEKIADDSWNVPFRVGDLPLSPRPPTAEVPAHIISTSGARNESARASRREHPAPWLVAAAVVVLAITLLIGGHKWGHQPPSEEPPSEVPRFEPSVPARVDRDPDESGVPPVGRAPTKALVGTAFADAATEVTEFVLRASLITGSLPGQKLAPCDKRKNEVKYKGACWRILYTERSCDDADVFEPEVGYCKKYRLVYEPVYVDVKAKKPSPVLQPTTPDVPILQDR